MLAPSSPFSSLRIACLAISLALIACIPAQAQRAPDFTLKDLSGEAWRLGDASAGKVVLLDFWATWCVPCVKELPHLQRFHDAYAEKGLAVVTISIDAPEKVADVAAFVGRYGYSFTVLLDSDSRVASLYNPSLIVPHAILVDRSGVIREVHQGYSPGDERLLEQRITALLAETEAQSKSATSLQVNDSFLLRLPKTGTEKTDADGRYTESLNQLDVTLSNHGLLAGARLDGSLDLSPVSSQFRLAKRYVEYSTKSVRARAGDFYTSLGRGLVFSLAVAHPRVREVLARA